MSIHFCLWFILSVISTHPHFLPLLLSLIISLSALLFVSPPPLIYTVLLHMHWNTVLLQVCEQLLFISSISVCASTHTHAVRVVGWGVGFSHRHWGPEIALELHYLRAVAAESREEKNQFSPRAPLSASTSLCPYAGAIPLFLFLPSVLPNKAHSLPQHTHNTQTHSHLSTCCFSAAVSFKFLLS